MWTLKNLISWSKENTTQINNKWVPIRPINGTKGYCSLLTRFKNAWEVFMCRAEAFKWDENQ